MTAAHSVESHTSAETARSLIPGARHLLGHLLIPVYLALGMALAYLGAFHQVEPHHLPVSIVGSSPQTSVLATTVGDQAGPQLSVSTIASLDQARSKVGTGALAAAFAPSANQPTVIIDSAASPTAAQVAQTVFDKVAEVQGKRLVVQDLQPLPANDALGSNLFFLLVALTVGGYTAAATLGVAGAAARVPYRVRTLLGILVAGVIALVGTVVAGPVIGAVHGHLVELGLIAWLYVSGVVLFGSALHAFFGRFTTSVLVTLFVMLNFTSSGGVYDARLQAGLFSGLANVWTGSAFLRTTRGLLYRHGAGMGSGLTVLCCWLAIGLVLVVVAARVTHRRAAAAAAGAAPLSSPPVREHLVIDARQAEDEELEEAVAT